MDRPVFSRSKIILIAVFALIAVVSAVKVATLKGGGINLIREQIEFLQSLYLTKPAAVLGIFFLVFVASTAFAIPLGNVLAVLGGAIFGTKTGLVASCLASATGATCAFLIARYLLREPLSKKYGRKIEPILKMLDLKGFAYVVAMRFAFFFPYTIVNWALGISRMNPVKFFLATFVGQAPIKYIFVAAGTHLLTLQKIGDVITPPVIIIFVAFTGSGIAYATYSKRKLEEKTKVDSREHIHG